MQTAFTSSGEVASTRLPGRASWLLILQRTSVRFRSFGGTVHSALAICMTGACFALDHLLVEEAFVVGLGRSAAATGLGLLGWAVEPTCL